jgi:hypothetical protein
MEPKRVVLFVVLGGVLSVATGFLAMTGLFSLTPLIVLIILVALVVVLLVREFKQWVESLVEKIAAGNRFNPSESDRINESVASIKAGLARIEERLDALEKKE